MKFSNISGGSRGGAPPPPPPPPPSAPYLKVWIRHGILQEVPHYSGIYLFVSRH